MSDRQYRRTVLASLGTAAATALAGCNSTTSTSSETENRDSTVATNTSTSTQSSNGDVFESVEPTIGTLPTRNREGPVLDVSLTDASFSATALRTSDGQEIVRRQLGTGTATQLPLVDIEAGTFDVVAVKDGEIAGKQSVTLERSYEVENVSFSRTTALDSDTPVLEGFEVSIKNTGDLPVTFSEFIASEGVPNPTPEDAGVDVIVKGEPGADTVCNPGKSMTLQTWGKLLMVNSTEGPETSSRTTEAELVSEQAASRTLRIEYQLSGEVYSSVGGWGRGQGKLKSWSVVEA